MSSAWTALTEYSAAFEVGRFSAVYVFGVQHLVDALLADVTH